MLKETIIGITDGGNDLKFKIRQMPASQLYDFIMDVVLVLSDSGLKITSGGQEGDLDVEAIGARLMTDGLQALRGVQKEKAKPLLDRLLACASRIDGGIEQVCTPEILDGFITDVRTIFKLQMEAAKLNFGFFSEGQESPSNSPEALNIGRPAPKKG